MSSVNPLTWIRLGNKIRKEAPDILLTRYWQPFFAPCLATVAHLAKQNGKTKVITLIDNMIPHETKPWDTPLSRIFVRNVDAFLTMSQKVLDDVNRFDKHKPKALSPHPLFDTFGKQINHTQAQQKIALDPNNINIMFFGLIREYKGLDLLLDAMRDPRLKEYPIKLLVAGEFYDSREKYFEKVVANHLENIVRFCDWFIKDEDVKYYFCSTDLVCLPYKSATQSGVTQIAFHFNKPMLVTDVGGLKEIVKDGLCGYVVKPDTKSIADALLDFCTNRPDFTLSLKEEKKKYGWDIMTKAIMDLYQKVK